MKNFLVIAVVVASVVYSNAAPEHYESRQVPSRYKSGTKWELRTGSQHYEARQVPSSYKKGIKWELRTGSHASGTVFRLAQV